MANILEYDVLDELEQTFRQGFQITSNEFVAIAQEDPELDVDLAESLSLEYVLVVGDWVEGDATEGTTPLNAIVGVSYESEDTGRFGPLVSEVMESIMNSPEFTLAPSLAEVLPSGPNDQTFTLRGVDVVEEQVSDQFFPEREPRSIPIGSKREQINDIIVTSAERVVLDLFRREVWSRVEGDPRPTPVEEYIETELVQEEEEPIVDGELPDSIEGDETEEESEEEEEPTIEDIDEDEPQERLEFIIENTVRERDGEKFQAKAGKETKSIDMRDPYEFELRMQTSVVRRATSDIRGLGGPSMITPIDGGIGPAKDQGSIGNSIPPKAFPRTGVYIREYLKSQGPAYPLQIYNDLVWYGWFISNLYGGRYYASSYSNIRVWFNRLELLYERDIVEEPVVEALTIEEAQNLDLDTMAKINKGTDQEQDAPWLERRQYYAITQFGEEFEGWTEVNELLYGEE